MSGPIFEGLSQIKGLTGVSFDKSKIPGFSKLSGLFGATAAIADGLMPKGISHLSPPPGLNSIFKKTNLFWSGRG